MLPDNPPPVSAPTFLEPVKLFGGIFVASSFAGLAALLRSRQKVSFRAVASAMLNSGFIGTIIGLIWYSQYRETNLYFLVGVSILAGLGGSTTIDFVLQVARVRFGVQTGGGEQSDRTNPQAPPTTTP